MKEDACVYIQKWVWRLISTKNPEKYNNDHPTYQGKKVVLT